MKSRLRNERLAELLRRMRVCEEKGSGIDKAVHLAEVFQLPAPDFRTSETRTTAVLFAHQDFAEMSKPDRILRPATSIAHSNMSATNACRTRACGSVSGCQTQSRHRFPSDWC